MTLGLRHTDSPGTDPVLHGPHNHGYQAVTAPDGTRHLVDVTTWSGTDTWASGDLVSTADDLERFLTALFRGRLVPEPYLQEMFTVPDVPMYRAGDEEDAADGDGDGEPARFSAGLMRVALADGTEVVGQDGGALGLPLGGGRHA